MTYPTPEQIEAAAKSLWAFHGLNGEWESGTHEAHEETREDARHALVAAAGATPQEPVAGKRLDPGFRAELVDIAEGSIQAVWDDVPAGVDAETLAQNVVGAQEFAWIARGFPVTPQEPVEPHDCSGIAMIAEVESLKPLLDTQRQRGDFWERRHKESAQVDEAKLAAFLGTATHAPSETHDNFGGACTECPWPVHELPPAELAAAVAEWLRGGGR